MDTLLTWYLFYSFESSREVNDFEDLQTLELFLRVSSSLLLRRYCDVVITIGLSWLRRFPCHAFNCRGWVELRPSQLRRGSIGRDVVNSEMCGRHSAIDKLERRSPGELSSLKQQNFDWNVLITFAIHVSLMRVLDEVYHDRRLLMPILFCDLVAFTSRLCISLWNQ